MTENFSNNETTDQKNSKHNQKKIKSITQTNEKSIPRHNTVKLLKTQQQQQKNS